MSVTADTNLETLTVDQVNFLIEEAGSDIRVTEANFIQINASDEYQYEVEYISPNYGPVTNHVFVEILPDGEPSLAIDDLGPEHDLDLSDNPDPIAERENPILQREKTTMGPGEV